MPQVAWQGQGGGYSTKSKHAGGVSVQGIEIRIDAVGIVRVGIGHWQRKVAGLRLGRRRLRARAAPPEVRGLPAGEGRSNAGQSA
jgi:hypothetical protein